MWMGLRHAPKGHRLRRLREGSRHLRFRGLSKNSIPRLGAAQNGRGQTPLSYRAPDDARLAWARKVAATVQGPVPKTQPEIYALEAIYLHDRPRTILKLQALAIGDLGIAAIPNEVYALTGLKIKASSPFTTTFNMELANVRKVISPRRSSMSSAATPPGPRGPPALRSKPSRASPKPRSPSLRKSPANPAGKWPKPLAPTPTPCSRPNRSPTGA